MKIALAIENFSRHAGGAEAYATDLATTLIREGFEVHFYGHSWDGEPTGAVFHPIPRLPKWVPPSVRIMSFALHHRRMVAQEHFDVILGFGNTLQMNVYQSHGGVHYLSNVRKLQRVRNPVLRFLKALALRGSPKYHARAWIESAPFRRPQRPIIIAISEMVRKDMASYFGINHDEIRLIYNGIDLARFAARPTEKREELRNRLGFDTEVLFLFITFDFKKKGGEYLVQAAETLKQQVGEGQFGLVVVGDSPPPAVRRWVQDSDLSRSIVFHGPTKEPEAFYAACDVFILPTFYDACSLVVLEAMAAGLPAITTMSNGAAGVITEGVDGAIVQDPRNINGMAAAMRRFLDKDKLQAASEAARLNR